LTQLRDKNKKKTLQLKPRRKEDLMGHSEARIGHGSNPRSEAEEVPLPHTHNGYHHNHL
jgi:hypothetical protein